MIAVIYLILGYWAVGRTLYRNKVVFGSYITIITQKFVLGCLFGWALIPIALLMMLFGK